MANTPVLLLGTHYHPGGPDTLRRQNECAQQLRSLKGVRLVNLQFPDLIRDVDGFETVPELYSDSVKVSGNAGTRKPVGSEAFQLLARKAKEYNIPYFAWTNSDILVSQGAVDLVAQRDCDSYIFQRMDFEREDGLDTQFYLGGQDLFVYSVEWWSRHGFRFRPYINSEAYWDTVYTAISCCHGNCNLVNNQALIRHENHPRVWSNSPFADYNRYFASLDTLYWRLWNSYKIALLKLREIHASPEEERNLKQNSFPWPPSFSARVWQLGRNAKAWGRFRRQRWAASRL